MSWFVARGRLAVRRGAPRVRWWASRSSPSGRSAAGCGWRSSASG